MTATTAAQLRSVRALLCALGQQDLTATAYRLILTTIERMISRGVTVEAVPTTWVAAQLGCHRNAIGVAYAQLAEAGLLERIPSPHRGAPTRTRLAGAARQLTLASIGEPCAATGNIHLRSEPSGPTDPTGPDLLATINVQAPPADPCEPDPQSAPAEHVSKAMPVQAEQGRAPTFHFDPAVNAAMISKVPRDARIAAATGPTAAASVIDPAWNLTDDEQAHYLALIPRPTPVQTASRPSAAAKPAKSVPTAPPELMAALAQAHRRLAAITGSPATAAAIGDQIAYQVAHGGLGRGDIAGGVRAGLSLVAAGRWQPPHQFGRVAAQWRGLTARSVIAASLH